MSAIWGQISFDNKVNIDNRQIMQDIYQNKCKLDKYEYIEADNYFMSIGKQFIKAETTISELTTTIVSDCSIDNREELFSLLDDMMLEQENASDEEIIVYMYKKFGKDFVNYLRGLYAIAIYDSRVNSLELYTDPVSARSLYYYIDTENKVITFSTLIEPIRQLYPDIDVDICYIKDYLISPGLKPNMEAGRTAYDGIRQVLPGRIQTISLGQDDIIVTEEKYFEITPLTDVRYKDEKEIASKFRQIYEAAVTDAIKSDGNIAVSMSSGLDSASIGALAASALAKDNKKLYTYTYVPEHRPEQTRINNVILDETDDVQKILALHPNMVPHFLNNEGRNCYELLERDLEVMEMPIKAYVNFPNLFEIYDRARLDGCKVVLTGQTGNGSVSFGYIDDVLFQLFESHRYLTMYRYLNRYSKTVRESRKKSFKACFELFRHSKRRKQNDRKEIREYKPVNRFLSESILDNYNMGERFYKADMKFFRYMPTDRKDYRSHYFDDALYAYIGAMETKMGLYSGVLIRDVTKDVRMLRFCYHLPFRYFAYQGTPRWLIRNNMRDILPNDLLDDWMRYGLQNKDCFERVSRDWEYVSKKALEIIDSSRKNENYNGIVTTLIDIDGLESFYSNNCQCNSEWETEFDYATFALMVLLFYQK